MSPPIRLVALVALSQLAPDRYEFDPTASPEAMEEAYRKAREAGQAQ